MLKSRIHSVIEIWDKDYINKEACMYIKPEDENVEIVQIEHAYDDEFIVEIIRKNRVEDIVKTKRVLVEEDLDE